MSSHLGRGCAGRQKSLDKQKGIEEVHKEPLDRETDRRQEMIIVMEVGLPEGVRRAEGRVKAAGWGDGGGVGGDLGRPLMPNKGAQMVVVGAGPLKRVWGNQSYMFILELSPWPRVEDNLERSGGWSQAGDDSPDPSTGGHSSDWEWTGWRHVSNGKLESLCNWLTVGVNPEEEVCISMVSGLNAKVVSCVILLREVSRRMFRCVWTDDFLLC